APPPTIYALSLHDALPICLAVGHVLETELHVSLSTALVAEHLEASAEPFVNGPLDVGHRDVAVATRGGFHPATQRDHAGGEMERSEEHTSELQSPYDLVCR